MVTYNKALVEGKQRSRQILQHEVSKYISSFSGQKILVIGDMVADVYLEGKISRISREAPVLILDHDKEIIIPGGAANAVHNVATLGGNVLAAGIIGEDVTGRELSAVLKEIGVVTEGLLVDKSRPTITKTRIMAGGQATVRQQIVRIDKEKREPVSPDMEERLLSYIMERIQAVQCVVFSDYGNSVITPRIINEVIDTCNRQNIPCIVDSRYRILEYKGVTVVKQNESEAAAAVGFPVSNPISLMEAGKKILDELGAKAVLITRGPDGMTLFESDGTIVQIPVTNKSEVYDVTGAGDTVVATIALGLAAGADYETAARLANFAAGIVVRKPGTATTTQIELKNIVEEYES